MLQPTDKKVLGPAILKAIPLLELVEKLARKEGYCYARQAQLVGMLHLRSVRTVREHAGLLVKAGLLKVKATGRANHYELTEAGYEYIKRRPKLPIRPANSADQTGDNCRSDGQSPPIRPANSADHICDGSEIGNGTSETTSSNTAAGEGAREPEKTEEQIPDEQQALARALEERGLTRDLAERAVATSDHGLIQVAIALHRELEAAGGLNDRLKSMLGMLKDPARWSLIKSADGWQKPKDEPRKEEPDGRQPGGCHAARQNGRKRDPERTRSR